MSKIYGYVRVSSNEQNEIRQVLALRNAGVENRNIFIDKQSGKDFSLPLYPFSVYFTTTSVSTHASSGARSRSSVRSSFGYPSGPK